MQNFLYDNPDSELIDLDSIFENESITSTTWASTLLSKANDSLDSIKNIISSSPSFINLVKSTIPQTSYQAILSGEQQAKIATRALKLMQKNTGELMATLVNPNTGKIVSTVALEKISNIPNLQNALTNFAMQQQLARISEQIELLCLAVEEVRVGQENDRLAAALSCEQKLIQAMKITNPELKTMALLRIAHDCEDSRNALMKSQSVNVDFIKQLPETFLGKVFSKSKLKKIDCRMDEIRNSLYTLNMVSLAQALAYQELNEPAAAHQSLEYFSNYIQKTFLDSKDLIKRLDSIDPSPTNYWSNSLPRITKEINKLSSNTKSHIKLIEE